MGHLWNYYRDDIDDVDGNDGEVCKYRRKILGKTSQRPPRPIQPDPDQDKNQTPRPRQPPVQSCHYYTQIS